MGVHGAISTTAAQPQLFWSGTTYLMERGFLQLCPINHQGITLLGGLYPYVRATGLTGLFCQGFGEICKAICGQLPVNKASH